MTMVNDRNALLDAALYRLGNPAGANLVLLASASAFKVALDSSVTPASISFSASRLSLVGGVVSFDATGGTLTVVGDVATLTAANMPGVGASVTASVTVNGQTFTSNVCSVAKLFDGATAKTLELGATSQVFQINKAGASALASISLTAKGQNLGGTPSWTIPAGTATLSAGADNWNKVLTFANAGSDSVTIQVAQDGLTDSITIIKVREGSDAVNPVLTNESANVAANSAGVVGSFAGTGGTFKLYDGAVDMTGNAAVTYSVFSETGLDASIAATGVYSVASMSADTGTAILRAGYKGINYDKVYTLSKTKQGSQGDAGMSVATVQIFQRSASATALALPNATTTLTFATGALTGLNNGWSQTLPPADPAKPYLQSSLASARGAGATDDIAANEWAGVVVLTQDGQTGAAGLNSATVRIYQRTASATAPALPSVAATYTFASGAVAGLNNGWLGTMPAVSAGAYLHTSQATAAATTPTDGIAATEWAASQLLYDAAAVIAAQAAADAANAAITAITTDNKLSRDEKPEVTRMWQAIHNEQAGIDAQADALGVSRTDYDTKKQALTDYLVGLGPNSEWTNTSVDTTIVRDTFNNKFNDVYAAKQALLNAIAAKAATTANWDSVASRPYDVSNLVKKGTFEDGDDGTWNSSGVEPRVIAGCPYAQQMTTRARDVYEGNIFPVSPGEQLYFSAWLNTQNTAFASSFGVFIRNSAGTVTHYQQVCTRAPGQGWALVEGSVTVPANGVSAQPWLFQSGTDFTGASTYLHTAGLWIGRHARGATVGAPPGTPVGNTPAETVESRANAGAGAANTLANPVKLNTFAQSDWTVTHNATTSLGSFTATATGGTGTIKYAWSMVGGNTGTTIVSFTSALNAATVSLNVKAGNIGVNTGGTIRCTATDGSGLSAATDIVFSIEVV